MQNPFRFRPIATEYDPDPTDWQDNPISNAMAWGANAVTPAWCLSPEHWTSRFSNALWTDCACCLFARGAVIGMALAGPVGFIAGAVLA